MNLKQLMRNPEILWRKVKKLTPKKHDSGHIYFKEVDKDQSVHEGVKKNLNLSGTRGRTPAVQPLAKRLTA